MVLNGASIHLSGLHIRFKAKLNSFFETISLERVFAMSKYAKICGIFPNVDLAVLETLMTKHAKKEGHIWTRNDDKLDISNRKWIIEKLISISTPNSSTSSLVMERSYSLDPSIFRREDPFTNQNWHFLSMILHSCASEDQSAHTPYSLSFTLTSRSFLKDLEDYQHLMKICKITDAVSTDTAFRQRKEVVIELLDSGHVAKGELDIEYMKGRDEPFLYSTLDIELCANSAVDLTDCISSLFWTLHHRYDRELTLSENKEYTKDELRELLSIAGYNIMDDYRFALTNEGFVISDYVLPFFLRVPNLKKFKVGQSEVLKFKNIDPDRKFTLAHALRIGRNKQNGLVAIWS